MRARSKKLAAYEARARPIRRQIIDDAGGRCMVAPVLSGPAVDEWDLSDRLPVYAARERCTGRAQGLHERRKRSAQGSLMNRANCVPACSQCNTGFIEDHPLLAHRLGLVVRSGDHEYQSLGRSNDV